MMRRRPTNSLLRRPARTAGGFTLPELILGIAITAMIGASCAAVALSVSTGWQQADASTSEYLTKGRTSLYVQSLLRGAKTLGVCRNGSLENPGSAQPATLLFWRADLNGDQLIQLKELAMLQHSVADSQLLLYQASFASAAVESTANVTVADPTLLNHAGAPEGFKANAHVSARVAGRGVIGVRFDAINTASTTQRPSVEFLLKMSLGGGESYEYGSGTLRPPQ